MIIKYEMANPKTCWWSNTKGRSRQDHIISITRTYIRTHKKYIYKLTIGRFIIGVML